MSVIIDRRLNPKNKSTVNRKRLIDRYKAQLKKAVSNAISGRSITDINSGEKVTIPAKDLTEPTFRHGQGGHREIILPGNKDFLPGDKIQRPQQGGGQGGSQATNQGEGEDNFAFEISREEFLELFFEDLELPHLVKRQIASIENFKWVRAGYTSEGIPANINILRSLRGALTRRVAVGGRLKNRLRVLEETLEQIEKDSPNDEAAIEKCKLEIAKVHRRQGAIPFIDTFDLKYNNRIKQPYPTTQAVMFCLMDVSGSMDEAKKDVAKRFFILLYLFLTRNYEKIEVVFIRHHTSAKEVDEQEFFYSRETGGTVVSSALELMYKIMMDRYPASEWNLYAAQASDGDNWNNDSPRCRDILMDKIMPHMQYFAYVEIMPRHHQSLWEAYEVVKENCPGFAMQNIEDVTDIYPVFRELFKRQVA